MEFRKLLARLQISGVKVIGLLLIVKKPCFLVIVDDRREPAND